MNTVIINEFKKLVRQIKFEIDRTINKKTEIHNMHRLKAIMKIIKILESWPTKITSSSQLKNTSGIGKNTMIRVDEVIRTGRLKEIYNINDDYQNYVDDLQRVFGVGPKTAFQLVTKYKIHSVDDLKKKYMSNKINLSDNVVKGLKYFDLTKENIPREEIDKINNKLQNILQSIDPQLFDVI